MSIEIDGLTLLIKLRDSHTPRHVLELAYPVVEANRHATAMEVYQALVGPDEANPRAPEGTLKKARDFITYGQLEPKPLVLDPLEQFAADRGIDLKPLPIPVSISPTQTAIASELVTLRQALEAETAARHAAEVKAKELEELFNSDTQTQTA